MGDSTKGIMVGLLGGVLYAVAATVLVVLVLDPNAVDLSQIIGAAATVLGLVGSGTVALWRWGPRATSRRSATIEKLAAGAWGGRLRRLEEAELADLGIRAPRDASQVSQPQLTYAPRQELDPELDQALNRKRFVVVRGPSAAGKSRSTAEAARRVMGKRKVLIPLERQGALANLLDLGAVRSGVVIWLSDLEHHVACGVDAPLLKALLQINDVTVVATIRDRAYQRLAPHGELELRPDGRDVIELAIQHQGLLEFKDWDATDCESAAMLFKDQRPDIADALMKGRGLGQYLVAGPEMIERLESGSSPAGAAVIRAAADWYRAGMTRPAPPELVRRLYDAYLPPDDATLVREFEDALRWACQPVSGARSMTQPTNGSGLVVHDYVLDHWGRLQEPIPKTTWDAIAQELTDEPADAATAAIAAFEIHNNLAAAERLVRRAAEMGDTQGTHLLGYFLGEAGRSQEAEGWYRSAADKGHAPAMTNLGILLQERGELAEAEHWYRIAADNGRTLAMNHLGAMLQEHGELAEAEHWYQTAAVSGDTSAMNHLGSLLKKRGKLADAERWYRTAAGNGDTVARYRLGVMLQERGELAEAERCYQTAAGNGHNAAMSNLGLLLAERGERAEAERWYQTAADTGHTPAMINLGALLHERGELAEADHWYRTAADTGDVLAMIHLGILLKERGELAEAEHRFRTAADTGDILAMNHLGILLQERGELTEAERWLRTAADTGDILAMNLLGILLKKRGKLAEAEDWYQTAADDGHTPAMTNLGVLLEERGKLAEGEHWFRTAANAGDIVAMFNLGVLLEDRGELTEAEHWLRTAADADDVLAMNNLGLLLAERGKRAEAEHWLRTAAETGNIFAMNNLGVLLKKRGKLTEAEHWLRTAADAGDTFAMINLGNLLWRRGD